MEDELARTSRKRQDGGHSPPPPPPKDQHRERKVKGGKSMRLLCYADDPREPELIGETAVDLSEVLTKGETDGESACHYWQLACRRLHPPIFTAMLTYLI